MSVASAGGGENVVVVAARAEREVSKAALAWALTHVVRPGDLVTLLAVLSNDESRGRGGWRRMLWGFPRFGASDCRRREPRCPIMASGSQMALQIDGHNEIKVRIKVVGSEERGLSGGLVAAESKRVGANWIVLDKQLKQEEKHCMEELQCNIVVMKGSRARVLRLNLAGSHRPSISFSCAPAPELTDILPDETIKNASTPRTTGRGEAQEEPPTNSVKGCSAFVCEQNPLFVGSQNKEMVLKDNASSDDVCSSDSDSSGGVGGGVSPAFTNPASEFCRTNGESPSWHNHHQVYWIPQNHISTRIPKGQFHGYDKQSLARKLKLPYRPPEKPAYISDIREAVSLSGTLPSLPPPLCSLCRHKSPVFGKPPKKFAYQELEEATNGFSNEVFVAEGWFGTVHRGVLADGRVVAVKKMRDGCGGGGSVEEFLAEVEVLSRAQHRNVVMLVGFCVEGGCRVLVYEYVCNGSLDLHLHEGGKAPLGWEARMKIAVGVARGLRYLHEDCRVGFIVHRDIRPNNILLTHDFDPLVGDFSITRWRKEKCHSMEALLPRTFGYLAPEYIEFGIQTEKSDAYAFGVVLLELITGRRAMDTRRPKGEQYLAEWARPMLSLAAAAEEEEDGGGSGGGGDGRLGLECYLDPSLDLDEAHLASQQVHAMARAAAQCLAREPQARPSMSKVLKILEGNALVGPHNFHIESVGSRSGRMSRAFFRRETRLQGSVSLRFPHEAASHALLT